MNFRVLDMVIISAKDLKQVNLSSKRKVLACASVQGYNNNLNNYLKKTPIAKDGSCFPMKFLIDVDAAEKNCLTLVIKLKADGFFRDKDIGEAHVPVKELLDNYGAPNDEMHASYSVWTTRSGKDKGVLNFSFKFGDAVAAAAPAPGSSVAAPPTPADHPYLGSKEAVKIKISRRSGKKLAETLGAFLCGFVKIAAAEEIFDSI